MNNLLTVPCNYTPRDYQLEALKALDGGKRRAIFRWPRRAGKDKTAWCYMVKEAFQHPGNYFYIFPTKEMARKALWENIDPKTGFGLLNHIPDQLIISRKNQEMLIVMKAGRCTGRDSTTGELLYEHQSTIRVVGYDKNPDSIRGTACKGVVLSEYAFSEPEVMKILMPSVRQANGWIIIPTTPNGRNHFFDLWTDAETSDKWYCSYKQTLWFDQENWIPTDNVDFRQPGEDERVMKEDGSSLEDVEREYGASFNTGLKGSYYIDYVDAARKSERIGTYLYDEGKPVNTYWDLGASDHNACWFAQNIGNAVVFIDYWEGVGQSTDELVRLLGSKGYDYGTHYLPHDAAPNRQRKESNRSLEDDFNDSLNDFKITGMVYTLPKPANKQTGIQAVRRRFSLYCFDSYKCADGLRHLELYHKSFDKKRNIYCDDPVHDEHSHAADAIRLEAEGSEVNPSNRLLDKPITYSTSSYFD